MSLYSCLAIAVAKASNLVPARLAASPITLTEHTGGRRCQLSCSARKTGSTVIYPGDAGLIKGGGYFLRKDEAASAD